jgi:putative hydrolase of the HAD superfamily
MKLEIPKNCNALLFDLGGVLVDLNLQKCYDAYAQLGFLDFQKHFDSYSGSPFMENFEEGKITKETFIETIKENCKSGTTAQEIITAWNAMLGDLPFEKMNQLLEWKKKYSLFLYSNTNALHVAFLNAYYDNRFGKNVFNNVFDKIYYSHEIGIRKPNKNGYLQILEEQQLAPQEIFYIDDGSKHIATAKELGIQCILWKQNESF